jgi:hypothetical protein
MTLPDTPLALWCVRRGGAGSGERRYIGNLARRLGYAIDHNPVVVDDRDQSWCATVLSAIQRVRAEAVFVRDRSTLCHRPELIVPYADVITVWPFETLQHWPIPPERVDLIFDTMKRIMMTYPARVLEPSLGHAELPVMELATAHRVMQTHIDCCTTLCPLRRQAKRRLVEAGHLQPAAEWPAY